jgi:hypothetical protein
MIVAQLPLLVVDSSRNRVYRNNGLFIKVMFFSKMKNILEGEGSHCFEALYPRDLALAKATRRNQCRALMVEWKTVVLPLHSELSCCAQGRELIWMYQIVYR